MFRQTPPGEKPDERQSDTNHQRDQAEQGRLALQKGLVSRSKSPHGQVKSGGYLSAYLARLRKHIRRLPMDAPAFRPDL
jgi:hypothetical protein